MFPVFFLALVSIDPAPVSMFVPRMLRQDLVYALIADGRYAYAQTGSGLVAWDGKGRRQSINRIQGEREAGLALDADHAYFIADAKVWKTPKPGRRGQTQVLAEARSGLGLAVVGDDVFFTAGETSQLLRVGKNGGIPTALVTAGVEKPKRAASAEMGQGVAADDRHVYWVFEDRVLRVPRSGGEATVMARSSTLNPHVLAVDHDGFIYADGQGAYRQGHGEGVAPQRLVDCPASLVTVTSDQFYFTCGADLLRVSRDGRTREWLDTGPSDKLALAVVGQNLFFADGDSGQIMPGLFVLNLGEKPPTPATGKPGFMEAVLAVRRWIAELGSPGMALSLPAPLSLHLGADWEEGWSLTTTLTNPAHLREVAKTLQAKRHPLLAFHTRYAWEVLRKGQISALDSAQKKWFGKLVGKRTVLFSHRSTTNCPYNEVIVAVDRVGKTVVPTKVYYEGGYDCE